MRGNRVGGNVADAPWLSASAGQVVNYISCQLLGMREVDMPWTSNLFVFHQDGTARRKQLSQ